MVELGFNIRGILSYDLDDAEKVQRVQFSRPDDVDIVLQGVQDCGGTIVRVWVGNSNLSAEATAGHLRRFLDRAHGRGLKVIACLLDYYFPREASWFTPRGLEEFYTVPLDTDGDGQPDHDLLEPHFFAEGYKGVYLDFVDAVVRENAGHPGLFAWEPGNELQRHGAIVQFMADTIAVIRKHDTTTAIAAGVLHADHATSLPPDQAAEAFYGALPDMKYVTVHFYPESPAQEQAKCEADIAWAADHRGRVAVVEELGVPSDGDRLARMQEQWRLWSKPGVGAIVIWRFAFRRNGEDHVVDPEDESGLQAEFRDFFSSVANQPVRRGRRGPR
jgi:hypothetical protein